MRTVMQLFAPLLRMQETLGPDDERRGARCLVLDGVCSMSMITLHGGPFLAAFAIALGATNYDVGLLATIAFASQFMQVPGLWLLQKVARRRAIVTLAVAASRAMWVFIICIPLVFLDRGVTFLMQWLFLAAMVGALAGPAWNSLLREVIPTQSLGRVMSRRLVLGTAFALGLTLAGGWFVDFWKSAFPDNALYAYSILFAAGSAFGVVGLAAVIRMPEKRMAPEPDAALVRALAEPVRDGNFRRLLRFVFTWTLAMALAGPFFIVYLIDRIGLSLTMITALVVTSQATNLLFLRIWGKLADRYSNKSVLSVSGPMFLLAILAWTFTTLPDRYFLTLPLLFAIHVLSGMSVAGVSLASANIALKLSPEAKAHSYMAVYGISAAVAGAVAPMLGGMFADFFATRQLALQFNWSAPGGEINVYALNLKSLDFLFFIAVIVGLVSMRFLRKVTEAGEVEDRVLREELLSETVSTFRTVSTVPGLRFLVGVPVSAVQKLAEAVTRGRASPGGSRRARRGGNVNEPPDDEQ